MNAVLKRLAEGVDCSWQWRAETLKRYGDRWRIQSDGGQTIEARTVLVTAPPRQSADLLGEGDPLVTTLEGLEMLPAWAIMLGFDDAPDLPFDAAFVNHGPLSWIARNDTKPGRDSGPAWIGHASAAWSLEHLESDPASVASELKRAMAELAPEFGAKASLCMAHRWRYAMCERPLEGPALVDDQRGLAIAGDWCAGDRIEGAWISGVAAARRLAALL
jgi:predicted NAD/FAD-dependent oxidoreductase